MLRALTLSLVPLLLAPALRALQDPSPATLLERAAYAEEHQRDFEAALAQYRAAADAAQRAGDAKVAKEALDALARLQERIEAEELSPEEEVAIEARIRQVMLGIQQNRNDGPRKSEALRELSLFGSRVVPSVKAALAGELVIGTTVINADPELWMHDHDPLTA